MIADKTLSTRSEHAGFDALLRVEGNLWQQGWAGELPVPGSRVVVHPDLPTATVVSVIEAKGAQKSAALLQLNTTPGSAGGHQNLDHTQALLTAGWTSTALHGGPTAL